MKKEKKVKAKSKEKKNKLKDIDDLIDDLAYSSEGKNSQKSKSFLDNMYLLNQQ
jgi:hypothetical protein